MISSEVRMLTLFCSAAFMISAGLPPQSIAEIQTFVSRTTFGSCFVDEGIYIFLRKTHLPNFSPYRLHSFFKGFINYFFKNNHVINSYCQDPLAFLQVSCLAHVR